MTMTMTMKKLILELAERSLDPSRYRMGLLFMGVGHRRAPFAAF